jgi:hypothetical protein
MDMMFFDPNGPFGLNADFLQGLGSEFVGLFFSVIFISVTLESYRNWRDKRRWRASRLRIAEGVIERHARCVAVLSDALNDVIQHRGFFDGRIDNRMEQQLESITRYFERNAFFLPPGSLSYFEGYRAHAKKFVADLDAFVAAIQSDHPKLDRVRKELLKFDFGTLERESTRFERSLGYRRARPNKKNAEAINNLIRQMVEMPIGDLQQALA